MNTRIEEALLKAILEEVRSGPRAKPEPRPHRRFALAVAASVLAIAAISSAITWQLKPDTAHKVATEPVPTPTTTNSSPRTGDNGTGGSARPESADRAYTFGTPNGTVYRLPLEDFQWTAPPMTPPPTTSPPPVPDPPSPPEGSTDATTEVLKPGLADDQTPLQFRLVTSDPRRVGISVWKSLDESFEKVSVEKISYRSIETVANLQYPEGMTEANRSGPFFWHEADGTLWMASGLLSELRIALPNLHYVDGNMTLGDGLVPWEPTQAETTTLHIVQDDKFMLTVTKDSSTDFSYDDVGGGRLELVDINGSPGARFTGTSVAWRVDPDTVLSIQASMTLGFVPHPTIEETIEAARSVRPATPSEFRSWPIWRGAEVERIVVRTPSDLVLQAELDPLTRPAGDPALGPGTSTSQAFVNVTDLDWPTPEDGETPSRRQMGLGIQASWSTHGHALPIDASQIGHRIRLQLQPASSSWTDMAKTEGLCETTVLVPPEGSPPIEVDFGALCG